MIAALQRDWNQTVADCDVAKTDMQSETDNNNWKKKTSRKYHRVHKNLLDNNVDCFAARKERCAVLSARSLRLCALREHCKQKNVNKLRHDATSAPQFKMNGTKSPANVSMTLTRRAEPILPYNGRVVVDRDFNRMGRF